MTQWNKHNFISFQNKGSKMMPLHSWLPLNCFFPGLLHPVLVVILKIMFHCVFSSYCVPFNLSLPAPTLIVFTCVLLPCVLESCDPFCPCQSVLCPHCVVPCTCCSCFTTCDVPCCFLLRLYVLLLHIFHEAGLIHTIFDCWALSS